MAELPPGFTLIDEPTSEPLVVTVAPNRQQRDIPPLPEGFTLIADELTATPPSQGSLFNSTVGIRQGLTGNFGDEIMAGLTTPIEMAIGAYKGADAGKGLSQRISDAYDRSLSQERGMVKRAQQESPVASTIGNVAGGLALGGQLTKGGVTFMKGAPAVLPAAAEGAIYGAVSGAGEGEGAEDRTWRAIKGGAIGGAMGGALGAAGKALANRAADKTIASVDDLRAMKNAAYAKSEAAGVIVRPEPLQRFSMAVKDDLTQFGYLPKNQPKVASVLEEIDNHALNNNTLKGLDQLRQTIGTLAKDQDAQTRALGTRMLGKLDDAIEGLNMTDILSGNKTAGVQSLLDARKLNSMTRKGELVDELVEKATNNAAAANSGGNIDNSLRQQFRGLLNDPKKRRGFSEDEIGAIRQIVRGTTTQNIARLIGKLSPSGGGMMLYLQAVGGMATGGQSIPLALAGGAAKVIADKATPKNVDALSKLIRSGGELPVPALTDAQRLFLGTGARTSGQQGGTIRTR